MKNKKSILIAILSVCMSVLCLFACAPTEEEPEYVTKKTVVNGFNHYDEVKKFAIDTQVFDGSLKVNYDEEYIKSGDASMEVYFQAIHATNPSLPVFAAALGLKDITNVEGFGVYVYNTSDYPFTMGFVGKNGNGEVIYNGQAEVDAGENDLEFSVDRSLLQYIANNVHSFELQFIGVGAGVSVYVDDLYAITTNRPATPIQEVEEVINGISKLNVSDKTAVYNLYEKYKALNSSYKVAITSYPVLKTAVDSFYMNDLMDAKEEDPNTVLFFNEPYGESQIVGIGSTVTTCNYSTEWAAEGENGSLKLTFMKSSVNWCGLSTSANIDIANEYITFTIFNDSDQRKMIALNWEGSWIIPANSEMTITCESTMLTREKIPGTTAYKAGGNMQFCGLIEDTYVGTSPEGTIYVSAIKSYNLSPEEKAFLTLNSAASHFGYYWHGAANDLRLDDTTLTIGVAQNGNGPYGGGVGTTLTPESIKTLYDLGYKKLSFTLGLEEDLYCAVYIDNDKGLEYILGDSVAVDANNYYFYQNGTEITIDIMALVRDPAFMYTPCDGATGGLHFVIVTGAEFVAEHIYKSQTTIIFNEIVLTELTAEDLENEGDISTEAYAALSMMAATSKHWWYFYHGAIQGGEIDGTTLTWTVAQNGNYAGVGTTLLRSTIQELYNLGFKEITFTLDMEDGLYCGIFIDNDTGLDYLSGDVASVDANNYYFYQDGAEITINLEALVNNAEFMNMPCTLTEGGLHFIVLTGAEFVAETLYKAQTTITLSNISFKEISSED